MFIHTGILALFALVGTTFAQTATTPTAATVEVWPEGKMPGKGANAPEAEVPRNGGLESRAGGFLPVLSPSFFRLSAAGAPNESANIAVSRRMSCFMESVMGCGERLMRSEEKWPHRLLRRAQPAFRQRRRGWRYLPAHRSDPRRARARLHSPATSPPGRRIPRLSR